MFATFAVALEVRAGAEMDVLQAQPGELGDPQSGLDGDQQQGVVAPARPRRSVRAGQEGVGLGRAEKANHGAVAAFARDGQDPSDHSSVFGMAQCGKAEQGVHGGQTSSAGGHAGVPLSFKVIQERADPGSVKVVEIELAGSLPGDVVHIADEQPEPVAVGGDGVRAGSTLCKALGEECFEGGGEAAHDDVPRLV